MKLIKKSYVVYASKFFLPGDILFGPVFHVGNDSMQGTVHEANVEVENENDDDHDIYSDDRRTLTPRHLNAINQ